MRANEIRISRSVVLQIQKMPQPVKKILLKHLESLTYPPLKGIKLLGPLKEYRKIAIGDYRLLYKPELIHNRIYILALENQPGKYQ